MTRRKGIILAGGTGSRLFPLTHAVSKQLLPVYDKPMIYYPLSVLIAAGVEEIAVITSPAHREVFESCLGNGRGFGVDIRYIVQPSPDGLAQSYILAEGFLEGAASTMILGDNLFMGDEILGQIIRAATQTSRSTVFGYPVLDPQNYGVVSFGQTGAADLIEEKPARPKSDLAVTGLYLLDSEAPVRARDVQPSKRGELEITDLLQTYLDEGCLDVVRLGAGRWFDAGSPENLLDAGNYVRNQLLQYGKVQGSPELAAFERGLLSRERLLRRSAEMRKTDYGATLFHIAGKRQAIEQPLMSTA